MKCAEIRELLITDYVDGEADPETRAVLERHLAGCPECREYAEAVRVSAHEPFACISRLQVPSQVWENVSERIMSASGRQSARGRLRRFLSLMLYAIPRPAMAAALILIMFIGASAVFRPGSAGNVSTGPLKGYAAAEELLFPGQDDIDALPSGFGTVIEEFFL